MGQTNGTLEAIWDYQWIDTVSALENICSELESQELLSLDTETVGWDTGNERLCLIQIGAPALRHTFLIDVPALGDIKALERAMSSLKPGLIAHNASFEERQLGRYGIKLRGVIDTLSMARKLRPDLPNHTLQTCARHLLGRNISKTEQTSDWSIRPLTPEQLLYARLDAETAYQVYEVLKDIEEKLIVDINLGVPDLMHELHTTTKARYKLTQEIAAELAFLSAREEMLKEAIRMKLVDGCPAYDGEYGHCKVSRVKRTEIDPNAVRIHFPEIAEFVISEHVERKQLSAVMKEHGIDAKKIDQVTIVTGYTDRLSLALKDV